MIFSICFSMFLANKQQWQDITNFCKSHCKIVLLKLDSHISWACRLLVYFFRFNILTLTWPLHHCSGDYPEFVYANLSRLFIWWLVKYIDVCAWVCFSLIWPQFKDVTFVRAITQKLWMPAFPDFIWWLVNTYD